MYLYIVLMSTCWKMLCSRPFWVFYMAHQTQDVGRGFLARNKRPFVLERKNIL